MNLIKRPFHYRYDNVVLYIIGINILVFLLQQFFPYLTTYLALNPVLIYRGWLWQFVSYMFAHGGISHLVFNMLALFIFGTQVERQIGSKEFLLYYMLTCILAGVFSFVVYWVTGAYGVFLLGRRGRSSRCSWPMRSFSPTRWCTLWGYCPCGPR